MDTKPAMDPPIETRKLGHETSDVNVRLIFVSAVVFIVAGLAVHFTLTTLMNSYINQDARAPQGSRGLSDILWQSSQPRLQDDPAADLAKLRALEDVRLNTYGWVDRRAGVAHIPIDRALDLLLKQGLPVRSEPAGTEDRKKELPDD